MIERKNFVEKQTLERFYEDVVEDVKKYGLDVESQKKVAYLLAAYRYFLRSCAPKEERGPMLAQLERADRKSTRLNSSHQGASRMPSSA